VSSISGPSHNELATPAGSPALPAAAAPEADPRRRRLSQVAGILFAVAVAAALIVGLYSKREDFATSLGAASLWILGIAAVLQILWIVLRSEAWHVCVEAAGGTVGRRRLYGAAGIGYLGNLLNPQVGLAVRITALRRAAPADSPTAPALLTAELPIVVIEIAFAAIFSFTLIGPLGVPFWVPLIALAAAAAIMAGVSAISRRRRHGLWKGLAVMRGLRSRNRIIALTAFAVSLQVLRNWLVLKGIGIDISVFDATALLIAAAAIGLLPVGPSLGVATAVLILGTHGVAASAAAGALLTATGAIGALCFASWALFDRARGSGEPLPA
jgi:uncharacterized membrane protein YbhN (UPF0104 family)